MCCEGIIEKEGLIPADQFDTRNLEGGKLAD